MINNRGLNTVALSPWAQTDAGAKLSAVTLINYGLYQTGFDFNRNRSYLQRGGTVGGSGMFEDEGFGDGAGGNGWEVGGGLCGFDGEYAEPHPTNQVTQ